VIIPWMERASFIPYPHPVVPPSSDIQDAPLVSLCLNEEWMGYVLGCLKTLARPETWDTDSDGINSAVEQAMRLSFLLEDGCMTTEQFRQQDDCLLQRSVDGGVTWDTLFDASSCIDALIKQGRLGFGGGSILQSPGVHGACSTFLFSFAVNYRWVSGAFVTTGDVISVFNAEGGTWDDVENVATLHCQDGQFGVSGICLGIDDPGLSGDPMPSVNHDRLILQLGSSFFDILSGPVTVPSGFEAGTAAILRVNNADTEFIWGDMFGNIEICVAGWTHHFSGSDLHTNFHLYNDGTYGDRGAWSGSQYDSVIDPLESPDEWLYLYINPPASTYLSYEVDASSIFGRSWGSLIRIRDGTNGNGSDIVASGTDTRLLISTQVNPSTILIGVVNNGSWLIDGITLAGQGADPF